MRILFTTEGTYPSIVGGVSTWCDQLVRGMAGQTFHLLEVVGPNPTAPAYALPNNVVDLATVQLWTPPRGPVRTARRGSEAGLRFDAGAEALLRFAHDDATAGFADGLRTLAQASGRTDPWRAFDRPAVWSQVRNALRSLTNEAPTVAETALAVNWLRGTLAPLLRVPAAVDQAHTTSNGLSAIPAWLASQEHGVPLMLTEHGLYLRERYLSLSAERVPPAVKLLRVRFYRTLARLIYTDADLVVSVSEFNRAWQIRLGAPVERTRVVYNGVAPEAFPDGGDAPQAEPTIAWVGRIDPLKDLGTLIESFGRVRSSSPLARLRLFGPVPSGNERYRRELEATVRSLGLQESVAFEGPVAPIHRAYHAADVVALSSVSEGFPYVAIEAMMCRRPVVATDVGGVGEAVGATGRMVEARNPGQLSDALSELLEDVPLRRTLGAGARERALDLFTLDRMYAGYRDLYAELANGPYAQAAS